MGKLTIKGLSFSYIPFDMDSLHSPRQLKLKQSSEAGALGRQADRDDEVDEAGVLLEQRPAEARPGARVLHDVSFECPPGAKVGVVGRTGAGMYIGMYM